LREYHITVRNSTCIHMGSRPLGQRHKWKRLIYI
jgi:hypothetical protein